MLRALTSLAALALCLSACKHLGADASGPQRSFRLLAEAPEKETSQLKERRSDVEVDTRDQERTPRVVARGETPMLQLQGAHAKLFGDANGSKGWSVDNFVLFEVVDGTGARVATAVSGYTDSVEIGTEHVDNVGPRSFTFEPGEVDLTTHLPDHGQFKIVATALDYGGVGKVSDLYLVLTYTGQQGGEEDLRGQ